MPRKTLAFPRALGGLVFFVGMGLGALPAPGYGQVPALPSLPPAPIAPEPPNATLGSGDTDATSGAPPAPQPDSIRIEDGSGAPLTQEQAAAAPGWPEAQRVGQTLPAQPPAAPPANVQRTDPPGRIGRVAALAGRVSVQAGASEASGAGVWLEANRNRPLIAGDSIWSDADGRVALSFGAVEVRLGNETHLQILLLDDTHLRLNLLRGRLEVQVVADPSAPPPRQLELCAAASVLVLQTHGHYRLDLTEEGQLRGFWVSQGGAAMVAAGKKLRLAGGQMLVQDATGLRVTAATQVAPLYPDLDEAAQATAPWGAAQPQPNNAETLRYVSRNLVGYQDLASYGTWTSSPTYGPLWAPNQVASNWAPFRYGHWIYLPPWGWTWVDDAPWGFAPFHYGRWVHLSSRWFWAPGSYQQNPIYAPHLVAFGGGGLGLGAGIGVGMDFGWGAGYVGWYPLGFYDPFYPAYPCSYGYVRGMNGPRVLPRPQALGGHGPRVPPIRPGFAGAVTVVPRQTVMGGLGVGGTYRPLPTQQLAQAQRGQWGSHMPVQGAQQIPVAPQAARPGGLGNIGNRAVGGRPAMGGFHPGGGLPGPAVRGYGYGYGYSYGHGGLSAPIQQMPAYRFEPHYQQHGGFGPGGAGMGGGVRIGGHPGGFGGGFGGGHGMGHGGR